MSSNSRFFFVLASVGAAIGLGGIWAYPYFSFKLTGLFFIPFMIALLILGFPLLLLEFSSAQFFDRNIVDLFASIRKWFSSIGWYMAFSAFIVMGYNAVTLAWNVIYLFASFGLQWKEDANKYFFSNVLQASESFHGFAHFSLPVFIALIFAWVLIFFCVKNGFESLKRKFLFFIPALILLLLFFLTYSLLLENSLSGINAFLKPNFSSFLDIRLWLEAFSMAAASIGLSYGIFHSFARKTGKSFLIGNSLAIILFEVLASILLGMILFAIIGFVSLRQDIGVQGMAPSGLAYQFTTLAQGLAYLHMPVLISLLFFTLLSIILLMGVSSLAYSITHIFVHKFKTKHVNAAIIVAGFGFLFGLLFIIGPGFRIMDIVSHFAYYNILIALFLETIAIGWFFETQKIADFINKNSLLKIGILWKFMIRYVIPFVLLLLILFRLKSDYLLNYSGDGWQYNLIFGVGIVAVPLIIAFLMPQKILDRK